MKSFKNKDITRNCFISQVSYKRLLQLNLPLWVQLPLLKWKNKDGKVSENLCIILIERNGICINSNPNKSELLGSLMAR